MLKQILAVVLLVSLVFPASIDVQVQNQSCPANANFLQVLYNLPTCIVETFFSTLISGFVYSATQFLESSLTFIVNGPDITLFCTPYSAVMAIIESMYTIALMGVGAYFIIAATDVQKRATAKVWLENIIFLIIVVSFSFSIFQMLLGLNQYITNSIYDQAFASTLNINVVFSSLIFGFIFSTNSVLLAAITFLTLLTRYIMIPFLLLAFPFAIFLYFLPFTKQWGAFMLKFIVIIVFMTSVDAVLIAGISYLFSVNDPNLAGGFVQGMTLMMGFGLIGMVNLIIYAVAALSLVSSGLKMVEGVISAGWKIAMLAMLL